MLNTPPNTFVPSVLNDLKAVFPDISWVLQYPDGSFAAGININHEGCNFAMMKGLSREDYGQSVADLHCGAMKLLRFEIIQSGYFKPRGVSEAGPVIVFRRRMAAL